MKRTTCWVSTAILLTALSGCSLQIGGNRAPQPAESEGPVIPDSSPFSQVRKGMNKEEVREVLGTPTTRMNIGDPTVPAGFAPEVWAYRGQGRVYFNGVSPMSLADSVAVKIEYNPEEQAADPPPPPPYGEDD